MKFSEQFDLKIITPTITSIENMLDDFISLKTNFISPIKFNNIDYYKIEAPGFDSTNINIEVINGKIYITGKNEILGVKYEFDKEFYLPSDFTIDSASIKNGILLLKLKNIREQNKIKINIE